MTNTYNTEARAGFGTTATRKIREAGNVPLTVSRSGAESLHVQLIEKDAEVLATSGSLLCGLNTTEGDVKVLVKEVVRHVLNDRILHIDTVALVDDKMIKVEIPVRALTGNCPGIRAGGLLEQSVRKVKIKCKTQDIPDEVTVDLSDKNVGQTVYAAECILPEGASMVTKPRVAIMSVIMTRGMRRDKNLSEDEEE